jgi:carbon starvation protein
MLQDLGRHVWPPFGRTAWTPAIFLSSALIVAMWGHFLWQGVIDPLGGINSLWPLFGISNQLLATVALCVATTVIIKMGKARYAWTTLLPLAWLIVVTMTAGVSMLFSSNPRLGFLARAHLRAAARAAGTLTPGVKSMSDLTQMIANDYLDAAVTTFFLLSVLVILAWSTREWWAVLSGSKAPRTTEVPFQPRVFAAGD